MMKLFKVLVLLLVFALAACGGGGGGSSSPGVAPTTYTLSGMVGSVGGGLAGVTVHLSGKTTKSTITDANGNYSFKVANGSYMVTPSLPGYYFSLPSIDVLISSANSTGNDFTAFVDSGVGAAFSISGTITNANPAGGADIEICAADATAYNIVACTTSSAAGGAYTLTSLPNGNYLVFASQDVNANMALDPGETYGVTASAVLVNDSDVTGVDFALETLYGITGIVTNNNPATGQIVVCANDQNGQLYNCTGADPGTGQYTLLVLGLGDFSVFAWVDVDGNNAQGAGEPYGSYASPVTVDGSSVYVGGIDVTIP